VEAICPKIDQIIFEDQLVENALITWQNNVVIVDRLYIGFPHLSKIAQKQRRLQRDP